MGKNTPENLEKIANLDVCKSEICRIKGITVIDKNNFVLDRRELIRDYRKTTGDYKTGWFKSLFTGKLNLDGIRIKDYQHEYLKNLDMSRYKGVSLRTDVD